MPKRNYQGDGNGTISGTTPRTGGWQETIRGGIGMTAGRHPAKAELT
jgi:hypothetical protein